MTIEAGHYLVTSLYSNDIIFFFFFFFFFFWGGGGGGGGGGYFSGLSNRIMREISSHWRLEPV